MMQNVELEELISSGENTSRMEMVAVELVDDLVRLPNDDLISIMRLTLVILAQRVEGRTTMDGSLELKRESVKNIIRLVLESLDRQGDEDE